MTLNMDDDLDMSMRAPYISMNESSELPLLIAEDLMWGAQPDLKETISVKKNEKIEIPIAVDQQPQQQHQNIESPSKTSLNLSYQNVIGKSSMDSSLASLLCSQLLQQQLLNQQQQQQTEEQAQHITINKTPEFKIKILDNLIDTNDHIQANRNTKIG